MTDDIVARLRAVLHNDRSVELMNREAADEIEQLRNERKFLQDIVDFQGTIVKMAKSRQEERDEARREICYFHHLTGFLAGDYANSRGWDCFENYPKGLGFPQSVLDFKKYLQAQDEVYLDMIERLQADRDHVMTDRNNLALRLGILP